MTPEEIYKTQDKIKALAEESLKLRGGLTTEELLRRFYDRTRSY